MSTQIQAAAWSPQPTSMSLSQHSAPSLSSEHRWSLISCHCSPWTPRTHTVISVWVWRLNRLPEGPSVIRNDLLCTWESKNRPEAALLHGDKTVQLTKEKATYRLKKILFPQCCSRSLLTLLLYTTTLRVKCILKTYLNKHLNFETTFQILNSRVSSPRIELQELLILMFFFQN